MIFFKIKKTEEESCLIVFYLRHQDYATWNYQPMYEGSLIPLPFTRPCKHTCEAVETACAATDPYAVR